MLGIMNIGQSEANEYFGGKTNSVYDNRKVSRDLRTYMANGRVLLNGVPVTHETPDDLWQGLLHKVVAKSMIHHIVDKPGTFANLLRRLSSKFQSFSQKKSEKEEEGFDEIVELTDENDTSHVTKVRIYTKAVKKSSQEYEDQRIREAVMKEKESKAKKEEEDNNCGHMNVEEDHKVVICIDRL